MGFPTSYCKACGTRAGVGRRCSGRGRMAGQVGWMFRNVIGWSLLLLVVMCALAYLQSTAVLSWMVA